MVSVVFSLNGIRTIHGGADEILKTVLIRDFEELLVLGAVIVLRALLSFLIHFEMHHAASSQAQEQ